MKNTLAQFKPWKKKSKSTELEQPLICAKSLKNNVHAQMDIEIHGTIVFLTKRFSALREHDFVSEAIFEHFQDHCGEEPDVVPDVVNPLSISL